MSCTCTEDKFLYDQNTKTETPWDGKATGIIIGRNRVMCQECIDNNARQEIERKKQELLGQIKDLESRIFYSQLDGDTEFAEKKIAERKLLKEQYKAL